MIVVFGSVNLDLVTPVERIAGPGETVLGPSFAQLPGGKGANQALAARRAGARVALIGATGADAFAAVALALLRQAGVDLSGLVEDPERPTGAAFISVDAAGQNAITVAAGANALASAAGVAATPMAPGDLLLLQREVPDAEGERAALSARARGARTVLNLAPAGAVTASYLAAIDIVVVNESEAAFLARMLHREEADHAGLAATLRTRFACDLIVTLGAAGAIGWHEGVPCRAASLPIAPVDTTGAGDTFVGAFAAALDAGADFARALQRGAVAGSLACLRPGAQPSIPDGAEITAALGPAG